MLTKPTLAISLILFCLIPAIAVAQHYTVTDLGPLAPIAINTLGQVVGNHNSHAYIWTKTRGMHDLGLLPGGTFSWAAAINDLGVVTGTADGQGTVRPSNHWGYIGPNVECSDLIQPFVWKQQMQGLGTLGPSSDVANISDPSTWCIYPFYGSAINNRGQMVGYTGFLPNAYEWGVLWTAADGMGLLGSSWWNTFANGISNTGQVVGENGYGFGGGHATWWKDGTATQLIELPDAYSSSANAVNDLGQIVGWSTGYDASSFTSYTHAVLWTQSGAIRDLGTLSGDTESSATKINFFGIVIGTSGNTVADPPPVEEAPGYGIGPIEVVGRPFIWSAHSGMHDLNTLIRGNSGWVLNKATDINVWGQIVGQGTLNGKPHGFLLTPRAFFKF